MLLPLTLSQVNNARRYYKYSLGYFIMSAQQTSRYIPDTRDPRSDVPGVNNKTV